MSLNLTSAKIDKILALKPGLVLTFSDLLADIAAELIRHGSSSASGLRRSRSTRAGSQSVELRYAISPLQIETRCYGRESGLIPGSGRIGKRLDVALTSHSQKEWTPDAVKGAPFPGPSS